MLQFALIKEPKEKLQEYVCQHIEVRQGFVEFINYCRESDIHFAIVSSGLDFYIEPVLAEIGMSDLELHCGKTTFKDDGIVVSYFDPQGNVIDDGFKEKYVTWFKKGNGNVVYLGDGLSDRVAARQATHVFATGNLQTILNSESIDYFPFTDFFDVLREVRRLNTAA